MANKLIPEELNALIQEYLTDGVLTDKERQVILKKTEKMGLDHDEIDLYLDAQVQKIEQQSDAAVRKSKGRTCPYCGGSVPQLTDKCPHCGEIITPEASVELQDIFNNLEDALIDLKSGVEIERSKAKVERYSRKAKVYYGNNPKIHKLLAEVELEMELGEKAVKSLQRKEAAKSVFKNKWLWTFLFIIAGALLDHFRIEVGGLFVYGGMFAIVAFGLFEMEKLDKKRKKSQNGESKNER